MASATITNVSISPGMPTFQDPITILVNGQEGAGPVQITDTDFFINDNSLILDLYLHVGFADIITPWSHSEVIGTLSFGNYDLTVNTFADYYGTIFENSLPINFAVVPEPNMLAIFSIALPFFRAFSKKRI
jgi:hypothetical protein